MVVDLIITVEDTVTVVTIEEDTEVEVDMASIMVDFADEGEVAMAILVVAADAA